MSTGISGLFGRSMSARATALHCLPACAVCAHRMCRVRAAVCGSWFVPPIAAPLLCIPQSSFRSERAHVPATQRERLAALQEMEQIPLKVGGSPSSA